MFGVKPTHKKIMSYFFVILRRVMELAAKSFIFTPTFSGSFHMFTGRGCNRSVKKKNSHGYGAAKFERVYSKPTLNRDSLVFVTHLMSM